MCGLHLKNALWTARQTTTGFSVNLFWPSWLPTNNNKRNNNKRRRKPRKKKKPSSPNLSYDSLGTDGLPGVTVPDSEEACVTQPCKPSSHHVRFLSPSCETDLVSYEHVAYEMRDDIPGVRFVEKNGHQL